MDATAVLDGFTITAGIANGANDDGSGGGMHSRGGNPTLADCTFRRNWAALQGGGLYNLEGSPSLNGCVFADNVAVGPSIPEGVAEVNTGGGMYTEGGVVRLRSCIFQGNSTANNGGGVCSIDTSLSLTDCAFVGNRADGEGADGGALNMWDADTRATFTKCVFVGNSATGGGITVAGGIALVASSPTLVNCLFSGNTGRNGGGLYNWNSDPTLVNCTFSENVATNAGGGVFNTRGSNPKLVNCILWGNRAGGGTGASAQIAVSSTAEGATVNYSCIQGGWTGAGGTGNISADPTFGDADGADDIPGTPDDDLHLRRESPRLNVGDNGALPADVADLDADGIRNEPFPFDLDGNPRITGAAVDMGAYEFGDCNGNGVLDAQDIATGVSQDCTRNGNPDECELDCNGNGVADSCDIATGSSQDLNGNGVPTECEPELLHLMHGLVATFAGADANTFVSPLAESDPLDHFTLQATEDLTLLSASSTYTGPVGRRRGGGGLPTAPEVVEFAVQNAGLHQIGLDPAPAPGEWLKFSLRVAGVSTGRESTMDVWLAHHPGDINQDGIVNIRDATAFGELFRNNGPPSLLDLNGDGVVDARDATTFGDIWHGGGGQSQAWAGSHLPPQPE